jgi:hypothetical protein
VLRGREERGRSATEEEAGERQGGRSEVGGGGRWWGDIGGVRLTCGSHRRVVGISGDLKDDGCGRREYKGGNLDEYGDIFCFEGGFEV